jgi:hypothetical protein
LKASVIDDVKLISGLNDKVNELEHSGKDKEKTRKSKFNIHNC